jgi:Na+/melibiose symporter-like transporter
MAMFAAALLMRLLFKPLYNRIRPQLVFTVHILLTIIRASVVYTMASKQVRKKRQHSTNPH